MRSVALPTALLEKLRRWAIESYPEECCGFLFSPADRAQDDPRPIVGVGSAPNERTTERVRRFVISAEGLRAAEAEAGRRREVVSGFFHSHPDHPARPSQFDEEHAWPWYSYLVLASSAAQVPEVGAFELDPERAVFVPVRLEEATGPAAVSAVAGGR